MICDMSNIEKKVAQKIAQKQYKSMGEVEDELKSIQAERCESEAWSLSKIMPSCRPSVMTSASFYHACMVLEIPCVLEVQGKWGIMDAVIEIDGRFYVIEFKSTENELRQKTTIHQILKYAQSSSVVVALSGNNSFPKFLLDLKKKNYKSGVFIYRRGRFVPYKLSTPTRKRQKE